MFLARRVILKIFLLTSAIVAFFPLFRKKHGGAEGATETSPTDQVQPTTAPIPLGADDDGFSRVYLARNGTPQQNIAKTIELMGGIESLISPDDIVVLKPNAQWWSQGMTNTDAMQGFIDMVLAIPGFTGEIIIAENHQYDGDNSRGWNTDKRNGSFNYNELIEYYQNQGHKNVTKYHWRVAGTTALPLEGDAQGNSRVKGPEDGDGYVWQENSFYLAPSGRKCVMTWPVFTSAFSGTRIDLKKGAWKDGKWLAGKKVRFINFSVINHHGWYCGVTASVKNLMGVVDMSCGFPGDLPKDTFNTHFIGVSRLQEWTRKKFIWRIHKLESVRRYCYRNFHHTGGALGYFMRHVRMPDLNIITAEWVGWGSRTEEDKSFRPKTILASRDPVALDYIAARDVLLPGTPPNERENYGFKYSYLNNPDIKEGPFRMFLEKTFKQGVGNIASEKVLMVVTELS